MQINNYYYSLQQQQDYNEDIRKKVTLEVCRSVCWKLRLSDTSVKKLLPPQAMCRILLGMRGLVRSYVTLAIPGSQQNMRSGLLTNRFPAV
jgi:hypothetical protein